MCRQGRFLLREALSQAPLWLAAIGALCLQIVQPISAFMFTGLLPKCGSVSKSPFS